MQKSNPLHDRIARATAKLAQQQARELVAQQRRSLRERQAAQRMDARRRKQVADVVFAVGAKELPDGEIAAALLRHIEQRANPGWRAEAQAMGAAHLAEDGQNER